MKIWICLLLFAFLGACQQPEEKYPVYKVDLDHPDKVLPTDLFKRVKVIPLQTTEKSRFIMGELGVKGDRWYILDKNRQLFFCFDSLGKFKYVLDNKPKDPGKAVNPNLRSILNPYSYYYQKKWYYYLTFRNVVYTRDQQGNQRIRYGWDFGDYNDDKEVRVTFPPLSPQLLVPIQKAWLKENCAFALTNARQNSAYIYTLVERISKDNMAGKDRFFHLFCYKPTRKCYFFNEFSNNIPLSLQLRLEEGYLLMLLPWWEKEKYADLELLDEKGRQLVRDLKETDNPVVLKWYLR